MSICDFRSYVFRPEINEPVLFSDFYSTCTEIYLLFAQCTLISWGYKNTSTTSLWWRTISAHRTARPSWPITRRRSGPTTLVGWHGRTSNGKWPTPSPQKSTGTSWWWESLLTLGPGNWTRTAVDWACRPYAPTVPVNRARTPKLMVYWRTTRFAHTWSKALRLQSLWPCTGMSQSHREREICLGRGRNTKSAQKRKKSMKSKGTIFSEFLNLPPFFLFIYFFAYLHL